MKLRMPFPCLGAAVLALAAGSNAVAADDWYAGASLGRSKTSIDHASISTGLRNGGITTGGGMTATSISDRDSATAGKLFGGYRFGPSLALEGSYFDLGQFGFTASTTPSGTLTGNMKARGLALDAVGTVDLTPELSAFGRAGVTLAQARESFGQTGAVVVLRPTQDKTALGVKAGAGLDYAVTPSWRVRLEAEVYRIATAGGGHAGVRALSVGLLYSL